MYGRSDSHILCKFYHTGSDVKTQVVHNIQISEFTWSATGRMCRSAIGWKRFSFRKSYRFCPSISNTRHAWPQWRKHSNAHTTLNAPAFSWRSLNRMETSIWPWRAYEGWFFRILTATTSLLPWRQHFTTWPKVPLPRNSNTYTVNTNIILLNLLNYQLGSSTRL